MENSKKHTPFFWIMTLIFIFFYPMLISIYVFLPLLIGATAYIFITGLEEEKTISVVLALLYILNLEVNLSLPLFLTIITTLFFYVFFYPYFQHFQKCEFCRPLLSVLFINMLYLCALFFYDFLFETQSMVLDTILLYSLIVDMLIVVIL